MSMERFRKVFSVIPDSEKSKPILVLDEKIITWKDAFREISNKTDLGNQIQRMLEALEII